MKSFFSAFLLFFPILFFCQESNCKCCDEQHKAFDFWVGEWEVRNPEGDLVGANSIAKEEEGCMLRERYKSTTGPYTGSSINFYNSTTGLWEQVWVDNQGSYLHLSGSASEGAMVLQGTHGKAGELRTDRISWTLLEDGRVRQLWEQQKQGEQWTVVFDGYYSRMDEE